MYKNLGHLKIKLYLEYDTDIYPNHSRSVTQGF